MRVTFKSALIAITLFMSSLAFAQSPRNLDDTQKWGLNDDNGIRPSVHWGPGAFQKFKQMGVGWVRYWFYWDLTQRDNVNPIDWSSVDAEISDITSQGLQVYADIMWAPQFATQGTSAYIEWHCMYQDLNQSNYGQYNPTPIGGGCGNVRPDVAAFQSYVRQAVSRYGDRIKYWSFWNEPNYSVFWHGWPVGVNYFNGVTYVNYDNETNSDNVPQDFRMQEWIKDILIPGAEAARSVNPNVFIVGPETANLDALKQVLDADDTYALNHNNNQHILDVISFHQYDDIYFQQSAQGVLDFLDLYIPGGYLNKRAGRPVWVTESWASLPPNHQGYNQATYTQSASIEIPKLLAGIEQRSWIDRFFFYGSRSLNSLIAPMTDAHNPIWGGEHAFLDVNNLEMPTFPVARRFLTRYQGCFTDDATRALPVQLMAGGATVEQCIQAAANAGYAYAGLQWYGYCFAGNNLGYSQVSDTECNTPCSSDSTEACGGGWRNSVYRVIPSAVNQRIYEGCYTDDTIRALPVQLFWGDGILDSCVQAASNAGYRFAGLQWYGECYAGNSRAYQLTTEAECNTPCNNKHGDTCGGAWRNSIWATGK